MHFRSKELNISAYNTNEKVYVQNDETGECLARMGKVSLEIFDTINNTGSCQFYHIIHKMKPTIKDWSLFKEKVKEYYSFELNDSLFNNTCMYNPVFGEIK